MSGRNLQFHRTVYLPSFCFDWRGLTYQIISRKISCKIYSCDNAQFSQCASAEEKRLTKNQLNNASYIVFQFNICLAIVQTDFHFVFLILRIRICSLINIEACFLLTVLRITKQVGIRYFCKFSFLLFYFLNIKRSDKVVFSQSLKHKIMNSPDDICSFKVSIENTRTMGEICPKVTAKTPERRQ